MSFNLSKYNILFLTLTLVWFGLVGFKQVAFATNNNLNDFYQISKKESSLLDPVVRLVIVDGNVVINATGFSVAYSKKEDLSYLVTNDHFCLEAVNRQDSKIYYFRRSEMTFGNEARREAFVLSREPSSDLCLLQVSGYLKPAKIGKEDDNPKQLDNVTLVGGPFGIFPIVTHTQITNLHSREILPPQMRDGGPLYLLSSQVFGGQSGSPVFNQKGRVIGVIFLSLENPKETIGASLAIPLEDLKSFLEERSY